MIEIIPKLLKGLRILYSIISKYNMSLNTDEKTFDTVDNIHNMLKSLHDLTEDQRELLERSFYLNNLCGFYNLCNYIKAGKCKTKSYFYGITITRNPSEQSVKDFIKYAERFKGLKAFKDSNSYLYGYECYDKEKNLINEHVHIFLDAGKYFSVKDFKKSFKHRIDVQRLVGDAIYKTVNYIKKDNGCKCTEAHYSPYMSCHYGKKE